MGSGEALVPMSSDQLQKIFNEQAPSRPRVSYILFGLAFGLIVLIAFSYWPSRSPSQHDAGTKSVDTDASKKELKGLG
jgi:hypothetical protein